MAIAVAEDERLMSSIRSLQVIARCWIIVHLASLDMASCQAGQTKQCSVPVSQLFTVTALVPLLLSLDYMLALSHSHSQIWKNLQSLKLEKKLL